MNFKKTILLWAVAVMITTAGAFAQVKKKSTTTPAHKSTTAAGKPQARPASSSVLPVDPNVLIGKLPNGLTYYIRANGQPKSRAQLLLVTRAGSVLETDAQRGLATLVQHMGFQGTRDFSKDQLTGYLTKLGSKFGPDVNAFTSYDETVFQLSVPTDTPKVFSNGFGLLANWAARINFEPAAVDAERSLLAAQAAQGGKTPEDRLQQQTLPTLLNNSRYGLRLPIGLESTIKNLTAAEAKNFYTDWYRPDLQAVIAVGDFDPKQVEELIKFNFSSLRNPVPEKPLPQYSVAPAPGTVVKYATDKGFPYTLFQVIVKHQQTVVKTPADVMQNIRINLFNQIINARVADLTRIPQPPILFGQAAYSEFVGKLDAFSTLVVANGPQGLETAVKALIGETERVRKFGFTLTELERAKQNALVQITNNYSAKDNSPSPGYASEYEHSFLTKQALTGIDYEYNYYIDNIGKISLEEMNALAARLITDQNRVILVEAPENEKDKLPNEQTLLKWIADAGNGLKPYVDDRETPFMTELPVPGKVASLKVDSTLSVVNITLTNGVKVILKPTPFTPNQILVAGYAFGGTSLASDQDFTSANLAAQVISNSGVASFNQTQVNKMIGDKGFSITPYIGDITQGITGYTASASFDSAMQLLYLYLTSPRKDAEVWKTFIDKAKSALVKNADDPGTVYQDTILSVLGGYNLRSKPATEAQLNAASLDKAFDFYKARFADASNLTFTFTGDFKVSDIVPYLATYLGSLPSTHSNETFKNLGIHPPAGQITKTVTKGVSDKSTVQLIFNGSYDYNDANNVQVDGLEEILNIRLVDSLKESNGIYSPSVRASYVKNPEGRYKITIAFLADASNTDKAISFMLNEINKIKQNGPNSNDVKLFIAREAHNIQAQYKQNTYWQAALTAAAQNQQSPAKILARMQSLEQVTDQSAKDTANKYLNNNNLIKVILLPEKK
ncbi:pitrilysin family protein [Mucilaginibacter sp. UR6-11]|uniref:M16 family metallopeptidase n=1 Tax=Mucilaginibacter sp. UR6-11 TaxID=1435644 RepID=UPI001E3F7150|nr:M16 family metallopeptidase [Mucilaginibacter sp. UR6-11]MCC8424971.1 insulinase family protein [Mucilaginibacter sp. UR6-11]